jgi:plastocyanin
MGEKKSVFSKPFTFYTLVTMYLYLSLNLVSIGTDSIDTVVSDAYSQTANPFNTNPEVFQESGPTISSTPAVTTDLASFSLSQSGAQTVLLQESQLLSPSIPDLTSSSLIQPRIQSQQLSPWFPSIPAIACGGGLFSFTVTGVPDKDLDIPVTYDDDRDKRNDHEDNHDDGEKNMLALQMIRDNNRFRILDGEVEGQLAVGEKNIEKNKWKDFSVEDTFNICRTLAYSSSPDVTIKTPLPTVALSDSKKVTQQLPPHCYYPNYDPRCGGGTGGQTIPVSIVPDAATRFNQAFQPNPVNVNMGSEITWTNDDTQIHTVTSGSADSPNSGRIFDSGILSPGATFTQSFLQPGIFPYYCTLHPQMVGTVIVS